MSDSNDAATSSSAAASSSLPSTSSSSSSSSGRVVDPGPIICPGHSRPVPDLAFSNDTPDGYFIVSACLDNKAMLRDGVTGDWIGTFAGHKGAVWCARLNPSATCAATAAADFSSKLWDALTGSELHQFAHKHIVKTCAFSTDGKQLITGGHEKKVRLFDLNKPESDPQIFEDHKATISNVWSLPDPTLFISAAAEKDIRVWDKRTGSVAHRISTNGEVRYCQTTLDGSVLSVCTTGKMVHFYSTESRDLIKSFEMPREIDCIAYDAVHQRFITGSSQELWVRCYDFKSGEEIACNKGHHGPVRSLAFNPNYTTYASGSEDGTIRIWSWAGIEEQMANMKLSGREDKEKGEKAIQRQ